MTDRERQLFEAVDRWHTECCLLRAEIDELSEANAELGVERTATDVLLGEAMDLVLRQGRGGSRS